MADWQGGGNTPDLTIGSGTESPNVTVDQSGAVTQPVDPTGISETSTNTNVPADQN